jgi:hypothetical protein
MARAPSGPAHELGAFSASTILDPQKIISICAIQLSPAMTVGRKYGHDITDTGVIEKHAIAAFISESPEKLKEHGIDPKIFEAARRPHSSVATSYTVHGSIGFQEGIEKAARSIPTTTDAVFYPFGTTDFAPYVAKIADRSPIS